MDKKGESYHLSKELMLWLPRIIIMVIVILVILSFIGTHVNRQLEISYVQSSVLTERLFYSPDCLSYQDENGIQVGVIDLTRFNEQTLSNCLNYPNYLNGVGIILTLDSNMVYINKNIANKFPGFCSDEESFACYTKQYYVLIKDVSGIQKGILRIDTIKSK